MPDSLEKNTSRINPAKRLNMRLFVGTSNEENRRIIRKTLGLQIPSNLNTFIIPKKTIDPGKNSPGLSFSGLFRREQQEYTSF